MPASTLLFNDVYFGTKVVFNGLDTVTISVSGPNGNGRTAALDLDDVDRLLAVHQHAVNPALDIAEFFEDVEEFPPFLALRAASAFIASAGSLGEIVY